MNNPHSLYRRSFLKKSSTAALALAAMGMMGMSPIPDRKLLKVALIGSGWYGKSDLFRLMQVANVEVVALCDVDRNMLREAGELVAKRQKNGKSPKLYHDYRELLAENKLDITVIGTPDHWHALQAIAAIKAGSHVYLQKPVSVDVIEGEAVLVAARKYDRLVQVGLQRRSTPHIIEAKKKVLDTGLIGQISHVEVCCYYSMRINEQTQPAPVPDFFDYDLWTGPAPMRPFDKLPHGRWRSFMEYGNGIMGDMCVHMLDASRWLLGLGWPKKISAVGGIYVQKDSVANTPDTQTAIFEFDELNVVWQMRTWGNPVDPKFPWAFKFFGENGTLAADTFKAEYTPKDKSEPLLFEALYEREQFPEDLEENRIELHAAPATRGQFKDLLRSMESGELPVADVAEAHISTVSCILANISMELGRPLVYDPVKKEIPGDPEATAKLRRPYRAPWVHPEADTV